MRDLAPSKKICVKTSRIPHAGRGVFTCQKISKNEVIETCPVIVVPPTDVIHLKQTELHNYYFSWGTKKETVAITLGFGSLYNHSYTPNARYRKHEQDHCIEFVALRELKTGEEITVNYNGEPDNHADLWIKSVPSYKP